MSDSYVVLVTVDFAPHDTDIELEVRAYEFSGPDQAGEFFDLAVSFAMELDKQGAEIVQVFEPVPTTRIQPNEAMNELRSWVTS